MGYTHYWTQTRDFTRDEWAQIRVDIEALLKDVQHVQGIPLGNGAGDPGTSPEITDSKIWFNGVGGDSHETFASIAFDRQKTTGKRAADGLSARRPVSHTTWPSPPRSAISRLFQRLAAGCERARARATPSSRALAPAGARRVAASCCAGRARFRLFFSISARLS